VDASRCAAGVAVIAFGQEQLGQERSVGQLFTGGGIRDLTEPFPQCGQAQQLRGGDNGGLDGGVGELA
jgi:hypothetical protein